MWQFVLTVCFTITTLFGPSLCCCSLAPTASLKNTSSPISAKTEPVKSCCQPMSCPSPDGEQDSSRQEKSKCPCGKTKVIADTLPTSVETASDLGNQLRLMCIELACGFPVKVCDNQVHDVGRFVSSPAVGHLSGRALLAAYSTLRC